MWWRWLVSGAVDSGTPSQWALVGQLGIGALVAVPFSSGCLVLWRALLKEREKSDLLQLARVQDAKEAVERERQLNDAMGPQLVLAATLLKEVPIQFERAYNQAGRTDEIDLLLGKLQRMIRGGGSS